MEAATTQETKTRKQSVSRPDFQKAFHAWVKTQKHYAEKYKKTPRAALKMADDALSEMLLLKPNLFEEWYIRNHYRYIDLTEISRRAVRGMMKAFLTEVFHGKIDL